MKQRTLRRKLQKKAKRKPYRRCPKCGDRMTVTIVEWGGGPFRMFKKCGGWIGPGYQLVKNGQGCGHFEELFWSGGGKADTYPGPQGPPGKA